MQADVVERLGVPEAVSLPEAGVLSQHDLLHVFAVGGLIIVAKNREAPFFRGHIREAMEACPRASCRPLTK